MTNLKLFVDSDGNVVLKAPGGEEWMIEGGHVRSVGKDRTLYGSDFLGQLEAMARKDADSPLALTTFLDGRDQTWLAYGDIEMFVPPVEQVATLDNKRKRRLLDLLHHAAGNEAALSSDPWLVGDHRFGQGRCDERELNICTWSDNTCFREPGSSVFWRVPLWSEGNSLVSLIKYIHKAAGNDAALQEDIGGAVIPEPHATRIKQAALQPAKIAPTFQRICIVWLDATHHPGYHNIKDGDAFPLQTMETAGWLVGETDTALLVAQTVSQYKAGDVLAIPKSTILEQEAVRLAPEREPNVFPWLHRTIGNARWLDDLDDDEWGNVSSLIMPVLWRAAQARGCRLCPRCGRLTKEWRGKEWCYICERTSLGVEIGA